MPENKPINKKSEVKLKVSKKIVKKAEEKVAAKNTKKIKELVETEAVAEAIVEAEKKIDQEDAKTAKAGKRSAKSIKEAEEKLAKEERKAKIASGEEEPSKVAKKVIKPARPKHERKGKNYQEVYKLIDNSKSYSLKDAIELAQKTSKVKFDATVELHLRLSVDPRQADQNIRDSIVLPAGTGKNVKVAVFVEDNDVETALKAGADIAGSVNFLEQLDKNIVDFDVLIATPAVMSQLGKYARLLGPKGLMPSPKSNTVTNDIAKAIKEAKAGRVEYRVDSAGIVHLGIGKVSFKVDSLLENAKAVFASIKSSKPQTIKGSFVKSIYITTTMGPSIQIEPSELA